MLLGGWVNSIWMRRLCGQSSFPILGFRITNSRQPSQDGRLAWLQAPRNGALFELKRSWSAGSGLYNCVFSTALGQFTKDDADEIASGARPTGDDRTKSAAACIDLGRDARGEALAVHGVGDVWHGIHAKPDTGHARLDARRNEFVNVHDERDRRNEHGCGCDVRDDHSHRKHEQLDAVARDDVIDSGAIPDFP
jgi:hypothetical protein